MKVHTVKVENLEKCLVDKRIIKMILVKEKYMTGEQTREAEDHIAGDDMALKMTRDEFIELTGENPEDILGPDWENEIENYLTNE